jgi:hypothetical protein
MIDLLPETMGNLIAIRMSGTVTEEDQDRSFAEMDVKLAAEKIEHLLLDWSQLDGWATGARSTGTWFGMHHRALLGRVAILADDRWADETLRVADILNAATVRRFLPSERQAALEWIRHG